MTDWPLVKLVDLATDEKSAISKPYGSAIVKEDYVPAGVPIVRGVNLAEGIFRDQDFVFISEELADRMPGARLQAGDLVFTHRGSIGQVSMIPRAPKHERYAVSTSQVKARLDPNRAVPEFYYYWFRSPQGQRSLLEGASTVGVPGLAQPVATIKSQIVPNPPLEEQRAIAATLGTLDDKIESNRRACQLLDELARITFRRWRAYYTPEDETTFGSFADVYGGATPKTSVPEYWGGPLAWTTPTDVTALLSPYLFSTRRTITSEGLASCAAALHPANTIFMTSRATIGAFALNQVPAATNQGFIAIRPKRDMDRWFLFEEMRSRVPEFIDNANGSTFLEISRGRFKELPLGVPSDQALRGLQRIVEPLHAKAALLTRQSSQLATLREALLPELLSGSIRVAALTAKDEFEGETA